MFSTPSFGSGVGCVLFVCFDDGIRLLCELFRWFLVLLAKMVCLGYNFLGMVFEYHSDLRNETHRWGGITLKKAVMGFVLVIFMVICAAAPVAAFDDDEFGGYRADELVIKVGYFGGPYYEKAVFSLSDLWAMNVVYADYTFIDNMPSVVIDHVAGVRLSDIVTEAGIDIGSVQTFFFWTKDKTSDYYTSYPKTELVDTPRYCYYSLPDNYDEENGGANEYADSYGERVDTLISLADDWTRVIAGATFGSDYANLNTNTRFRLVFGQTNTWEHTASRSAKWIHEIVVELGGAPTLTLDASVLDGEVGSVLRTQASVGADPVITDNEPIAWESSDERIATVDENGDITMRGEGSAVITATFAGVSASVTVNGSAAADDTENTAGTVTAPPDGIGGNGGDAGETLDSSADAQPNTPFGNTNALAPSEDVGSVVQINPPLVSSDEIRGGIQNWRVFEMNETATALPIIESDNALAGLAAVSAGVLLVGSGALYAGNFYFNVRRKTTDVYKRKPQ